LTPHRWQQNATSIADRFSSNHRDMKKVFRLVWFQFFGQVATQGQRRFEYGSNNGRQVAINGKKKYTMRIWTGAPLLLLSGGDLTEA